MRSVVFGSFQQFILLLPKTADAVSIGPQIFGLIIPFSRFNGQVRHYFTLTVIPLGNEIEPFTACTLIREIDDPAETIDPGNLKVETDLDGYALMISRAPIPFPFATTKFKYKKIVGVECYDKKALDFFVSHESRFLEKTENTNLLRFITFGRCTGGIEAEAQ